MEDSTATAPRRQSSACVNLRERFGRRYKVAFEESYHADRGAGARLPDPWLMIVLCRYGHIFPHGGETLAASVDGHPNVAGTLRRLPCCRVHQDGDFGEVTLLFDLADFGKVAKVMRPKRRRRMTEEQRQVAAERLSKYAFSPAVDEHPSERQCVPMALAAPEYLRQETA